MSVLVFADSTEGKFKKSAFEVVSYAKNVADQLSTNLVAVTINADDSEALFTYGAEKVLSITNEDLQTFNAKQYASVIQQAAASTEASVP